MKQTLLKGLFLLSFSQTCLYADDIPLRFHAQWTVGVTERHNLDQKYGMTRVKFDQQGHAFPSGLNPNQQSRWMKLYELCMLDGCYYCDAGEGSCETGTCGPKNASCKPFMDKEGHPQCGEECADFAFNSSQI